MISMDKVYKTKSGLPVRVICVDAITSCPVLALIKQTQDAEQLHSYAPDGQHYYKSDYDLVEYNPLNDFKLDDPIMVRLRIADPWVYRHFAGIENGKPTTFINGLTSFSNKEKNCPATTWYLYRKPTIEELAS